MAVILLCADDGIFSTVCQVTVIQNELGPLALSHEDVAQVVSDVSPVLQPPDSYILGAHLSLQSCLAFLLHMYIFQMAHKLDGDA